jgi:transcriptional regulator with XRE-family HTH domain
MNQMFQFTLRAARMSCGYTVEEAAAACGLSVRKFNQYEVDSEQITRRTVVKMLRLYGVSFEQVYFGKEADCIRFNRQRVQAMGDQLVSTVEERTALLTHAIHDLRKLGLIEASRSLAKEERGN